MNSYENHVTIPSDHFKKRVKQQYNNVPMAIAREAVQNAVDAGATRIEFIISNDGTFLAISDNGCGMTAKEFEKYFLTLGGTKKESGSIGGFGAAKEVLAFAWDSWEAKGQGFVCHGAGPTYRIEEGPNCGVKRGFEITIEDENLQFNYYITVKLAELSTVKCRIIRQFGENEPETIQQRRKLMDKQIIRRYEFGDLYVVKSLQPYEHGGYLYVRTNGLYSFCEGRVVETDKVVFYLELTKPSPEVLTENRESLRWKVQTDIRRDLAEFAHKPEKLTERKLKDVTMTQYGIIGSGEQEVGSREVVANGTAPHQFDNITSGSSVKAPIWDRPIVVIKRGRKDLTRLTKRQEKALRVWTLAVDRVGEALNDTDEPCSTGLTLTSDANACHTICNGRHVLCINPYRLPKDAFNLLELVIHEYAHCWESEHCQDFETVRMHTLAEALGYCYRSLLFDLDKALKGE